MVAHSTFLSSAIFMSCPIRFVVKTREVLLKIHTSAAAGNKLINKDWRLLGNGNVNFITSLLVSLEFETWTNIMDGTRSKMEGNIGNSCSDFWSSERRSRITLNSRSDNAIKKIQTNSRRAFRPQTRGRKKYNILLFWTGVLNFQYGLLLSPLKDHATFSVGKHERKVRYLANLHQYIL